jgi:hypothetical protein
MSDHDIPYIEFVDHYTWDGRLLDEPDYPDPPTLRRHCACGAFLPKNPRESKKMVPTDWSYTYDERGEVTGYNVLKTEEDVEWYWTCTKCKRDYDAGEMYQ